MQKKLGLALGSGADRGFAHIGVIKVLKEAGIEIDCVSGSSMGALVAAHYALHKDIHKLESLALEFPKTAGVLQLIDLNNPIVSFIKGEKIREYLKNNLLGDANFSDTKIPLRIAATTLEEGNTYIFEKGSLIDAVIASSTIPGILPPFEIEGLHLIDGGLADAIPLNALDQMGALVRIGVNLYSYQAMTLPKFNAKDVVMRAYRLYLSKLSWAYHYQDDERTIMLNPQTDEGIESLTFSRARPNILAGEEVAKSVLPKIKGLLEF